MDPLGLPSPRLLQIREETLVFLISAHLAVIGSLQALVVWPEVIHEASGVEGNPVRAHSFKSISPSVAFHWTRSISSGLERQLPGGPTLSLLHFIYVFSPRIL